MVFPLQPGTQFTVLVRPDPLMIAEANHHSADMDLDFRLSLTELLRVIELYNTRNGTVRTGAYAVDATNLEDGFATDSARPGTALVPLTRYHSADTGPEGNPDGRLSLTELLRVIELYNARSGTVRTGQYCGRCHYKGCAVKLGNFSAGRRENGMRWWDTIEIHCPKDKMCPA